MKIIIDRFEGDYAVVEADGKMINMPIGLLPGGAKEGSVVTIEINESETKDREAKIRGMMNELFNK